MPEPRNMKVVVRLTSREYEWITAHALRTGTNVAECVRRGALLGMPEDQETEKPHSEPVVPTGAFYRG